MDDTKEYNERTTLNGLVYIARGVQQGIASDNRHEALDNMMATFLASRSQCVRAVLLEAIWVLANKEEIR